MIGTALALGIGAAASTAGAALSAFGKKDPKYNYQKSDQERAFEEQMNQRRQGIDQALSGDYAKGQQAGRDYGSLLQQYQQSGGVPGQNDISAGQSYAQSQFDPQRVAMQQAFQDQLVQANRQAALSGRGLNDPILRNKLAQEQTRQQALLQSQQGAFASQSAQGISDRRIGYAGQRADALGTLGTNSVNMQRNLFNDAAQGFQGQQQFSQGQAQADYRQQADSTTFAQRLGSTISGGLGGAAGMAQGIQNFGSMFSSNPFMPSSSGNDMSGVNSGYGSQYASGQDYNMFMPKASRGAGSVTVYGGPKGKPNAPIGPFASGENYGSFLQGQRR